MAYICLAGVVLACIVIWRACDGFETATSYLGRGLSDGVRGATLNAIGSSMPELLTTITALVFYLNTEGFAFGIATTAGSDIFNSAVIPGLVILMVTVFTVKCSHIMISRKVALRDGLILIGGEFLLISILGKGTLGLIDGIVLISYYVLYLIIMFSTMNIVPEFSGFNHPIRRPRRLLSIPKIDLTNLVLGKYSINIGRAWILLISATSVIGLACYTLVESCYGIANAMNIRPYFAAVILAAMATSVPDAMISVKDAIRGEYEDAVSNALGSNIFDICICLGLPLLLFCIITGETISVSVANQASVAELRVFLLGHTILIFLMFILGRGMGYLKGWTMMILYGTFLLFVVARALETPWAVQFGGTLQGLMRGVVAPW